MLNIYFSKLSLIFEEFSFCFVFCYFLSINYARIWVAPKRQIWVYRLNRTDFMKILSVPQNHCISHNNFIKKFLKNYNRWKKWMILAVLFWKNSAWREMRLEIKSNYFMFWEDVYVWSSFFLVLGRSKVVTQNILSSRKT